jgi:uncharacterized protein involved in exopolysaccharide biosynthesis
MDIATAPYANTTVGSARPNVNLRRYSARDFLTSVFYHWRIMICAFLVPVLLGLGAASISKPVYVAQARLLVLYGGEYFYQPSNGQPGSAVALDRNEIMTSELEVLKNNELAKQTLRTIGVDKVYPGTKPDDELALDAAARRMGSDLTLTSLAQSNVLELSYRNRNPAIATEVLRVLIAGYLADRSKVFQRAPTAVVQAEQDSLLTRVRAAEAALSAFSDAHGIVSLDEQTVLLLQRQSGNRQARDEASQAIGETDAKLAAMQAQLKTIPPVIQAYANSDRSHATQVLTENLVSLQVKRHELAQRYGNSFPDLQGLDQQIQWVQAQIASVPAREDTTTRAGANPLYQDLQQQIATLEAQSQGLHAKQAELAKSAAEIDARIRDITSITSTYHDLKRNRDVLDETYRALVKSNEAAQVGSNAEGSRTANIRVVQPPELGGSGLNMRMILLVAGAFVGLFAALAAMALGSAFRQVFITPRDVSLALDLPVLATAEKLARRRAVRGSPLLLNWEQPT